MLLETKRLPELVRLSIFYANECPAGCIDDLVAFGDSVPTIIARSEPWHVEEIPQMAAKAELALG
jgi:hypothetical protein